MRDDMYPTYKAEPRCVLPQRKKNRKRSLIMVFICIIVLLSATWSIYKQVLKREAQIGRPSSYVVQMTSLRQDA